MTKNEAIQALESLAKQKKVFRNSLAYRAALEAINNPGAPVVCGRNIGGGNFSSSKSWLHSTALILTQIGVRFDNFNVAPQGGRAGDRISVIDVID